MPSSRAKTAPPQPPALVPWITAHTLAIGGVVALFHYGLETPQGAVFAIPVAIALAQVFLLKLTPRPAAWWLLATIAGAMASFIATWFFIAAIGFTMSVGQGFVLAKHRLGKPLFWIVGGGAGWLLGELAGLFIANALITTKPGDDPFRLMLVTHLVVGVLYGLGTGVALKLGRRE